MDARTTPAASVMCSHCCDEFVFSSSSEIRDASLPETMWFVIMFARARNCLTFFFVKNAKSTSDPLVVSITSRAMPMPLFYRGTLDVF